jgi:hypothetical protein
LNLFQGEVEVLTGGDEQVATSPRASAERVRIPYRRLQSGWKKQENSSVFALYASIFALRFISGLFIERQIPKPFIKMKRRI